MRDGSSLLPSPKRLASFPARPGLVGRARMRLFAGVAQAEARWVGPDARIQRFDATETVLEPGAAGDGAYSASAGSSAAAFSTVAWAAWPARRFFQESS